MSEITDTEMVARIKAARATVQRLKQEKARAEGELASEEARRRELEAKSLEEFGVLVDKLAEFADCLRKEAQDKLIEGEKIIASWENNDTDVL